MSKNEVSERDDQIAALHLELKKHVDVINARDTEIHQFKAQKYPERCDALQTQLKQTVESVQACQRRIEGMDNERRALQRILMEEIEYLRSA